MDGLTARSSSREDYDLVEKLEEAMFQKISTNQNRSAASFPKPVLPSNHVTVDGFDLTSPMAPTSTTAGSGLSTALACGMTSVAQIQTVIRRLSEFPGLQDESDLGSDFSLIAELARIILNLTREAFGPSHCLCQAAIGLYMIEDFIRDPPSLEGPVRNIFGRIEIPSREAVDRALNKLKAIHEESKKAYTSFKTTISNGRRARQGVGSEEMKQILTLMCHSLHNCYHTAVGCLCLFDLLLYIDLQEQCSLNDFFQSLNSIQKSDCLEDLSNLRRTVDHVPLLLEKLSWSSYIAYRVACGKSPPASAVDSGMVTPVHRGNGRKANATAFDKETFGRSRIVEAESSHHLPSRKSNSRGRKGAATANQTGKSKSKSKEKLGKNGRKMKSVDSNNNLEDDDEV